MYSSLTVWVTLNAKDKSTTSDGANIYFSYYQWHNLSYLDPAFGPTEGMTNVTIYGANFT